MVGYQEPCLVRTRGVMSVHRSRFVSTSTVNLGPSHDKDMEQWLTVRVLLWTCEMSVIDGVVFCFIRNTHASIVELSLWGLEKCMEMRVLRTLHQSQLSAVRTCFSTYLIVCADATSIQYLRYTRTIAVLTHNNNWMQKSCILWMVQGIDIFYTLS